LADVIIENPILNSAFAEPDRHFRFTDSGISSEIVEGRRTSTYFVPIARARARGAQAALPGEWTEDRIEPNPRVDQIRDRIKLWRTGRYSGVTPTTRRLLEYWTNPDRENKLFFCQIEALETAIYITECASKFSDGWIADWLREANDSSNPGLPRIAHKMATGSGKTVVMAMLIAWHALNKLANPQDARFSDTFLIVTPGVTIKDRLRVLLPNDSENYYRQRDLVPGDLAESLLRAKLVITNYHAFLLREKLKAPALTKKFVDPKGENLFRESPEEMVRRVCKELGTKKQIVVLNDEAHHCYRRKPDEQKTKLSSDDRQEAKKRNEEARVWISGVEAIKKKLGVKAIYDLSATPFFLRGSGYDEGTLFPWVVSDFSLIDAIESGIVKVPRVPVADDSMQGELPKYRDLWPLIRTELPKGTKSSLPVPVEPHLPAELQGALLTLYGNYEKSYRLWEASDARSRGQTPPVFIVVCNNMNVSKMVFDYISGYEKPLEGPVPEGHGSSVLVPGELPIFSNVVDGRWLDKPYTILVNSEELESGAAMTPEFKKVASREIEEFKDDYRRRFPGKDADDLDDADILREVMNTVGKAGKLGEGVRCVVSVSMLTEGWDANTVTHILGVRAFGTQLLCEQVVGRGLRRMSYAANDEGKFEPEYAEVYGVPFSFIPCSGSGPDPTPPKLITRVRALEERIVHEIVFPRLAGYKVDLPRERLVATFNEESTLTLSPQDIPTVVVNAPIVGESTTLTLDDVKALREQYVAFALAKLLIRRYFSDPLAVMDEEPDDDCPPSFHLFPQALRIVREWMTSHVKCKDGAFAQLLVFHEVAYNATDKIYRGIARSYPGEERILPILRPYDYIGSTRYVDFDTSKPTYQTDPNKCHISHVVADTDSWEQKLAQVLESMPEVVSYVKNHNLGFAIPYVLDGIQRDYYPDFIAILRRAHPIPAGSSEYVNVILEVTGHKKMDKQMKVETAQALWVPAVNNHGGLGEWAFLQVEDPWDCIEEIRGAIRA
jgi:type III restriction enzyme